MKKERINQRHVVLLSNDTVGERIHKARIARKMTQSELARSVGTVYQRIHEWECYDRNPSIKYLMKIADTLIVDVEWLSTGLLAKEPYCVYERFYSTDENQIDEVQYEQRKNALITIMNSLANADDSLLNKALSVIDSSQH